MLERLTFLNNKITPSFFVWVVALFSWPITASWDPFEQFVVFSQRYENWKIDALAVLMGHVLVALVFSLFFQSRQLREAIFQGAVERKRADRNALRDPLTGLLNRRAFELKLLDLSARSATDGKASVAMPIVAVLDLDRFKIVNDLHGHAVGDAALRAISQRIRHELGTMAIVARLGGDEFAMLFKRAVTPSEVEACVKRLLLLVAEPIHAGGPIVTMGVSIGLTAWKKDEVTADVLLRADKALYAAKKQGRGCFAWYDKDLDRASTQRVRLEADLRVAIQNKDIHPYFQPIIDLKSNQLRCFEILARWTHPDRGPVSPTDFISVAEESGQINELGWCIFRQACETAVHWPPDCRLAFNVSPNQFLDRALIETLTTILEETGFEATRLGIEITEHTAVYDFDRTSQIIEELRDLGVFISLDDFGTGYSSLTTLRNLPFDCIKIDRSFVTDISQDISNQQIVRGIVSLARGLNIQVTAEGIETQEDLDFICGLDCTYGQGYLFERAVSGEQAKWLIEMDWAERLLSKPGTMREVCKEA